ncbi:hypothetical protein D918_01430 [Trichuris suis]|nr:hypothetical protein D918_01430 [Trichuris suis]
MQSRSSVSRASRLADDSSRSSLHMSLRSSSRNTTKKNILSDEANLSTAHSSDLAVVRAVDQGNDDHVLLLARNLVNLVANQQAPVLTSLTAAQLLEAIIENRALIDKIRESIDRKQKGSKMSLRPRTDNQATSGKEPAVSENSDEPTSVPRKRKGASRGSPSLIKCLLSDRLLDEDPNDVDFVSYNLVPSDVSTCSSEAEFSDDFLLDCEQHLESLADCIDMDESMSISPSNLNKRGQNENGDDSDFQVLDYDVSTKQNLGRQCSSNVAPTKSPVLQSADLSGVRINHEPFPQYLQEEVPCSSQVGFTTANLANMQANAQTPSDQISNSQAGESEIVDLTTNLEDVPVPHDQSYSTNPSGSLIPQNPLVVIANTITIPANVLILQSVPQNNCSTGLQEAPVYSQGGNSPVYFDPQLATSETAQPNIGDFDPSTLGATSVESKMLTFEEIAKFLHFAPVNPESSREFTWLHVLRPPNYNKEKPIALSASSPSAVLCESLEVAALKVSITEIGENMFAEQMRQHVQMLLQSYLFCFHVTQSSYVVARAMAMLLELRKLMLTGGVRFRSEPWKNLENAFKDMSARMSFSGECIEGVPVELIELIARSRSFLYLELLPNMIKSNCIRSCRVSNFVPGENELAALCFLLLRKFFTSLNLCKLISRFALPYRSNNEIAQHLRNMVGTMASGELAKEIHSCVDWEYIHTGQLKACHHATRPLDERTLFERWPDCSLPYWLEVNDRLIKAYDSTASIL